MKKYNITLSNMDVWQLESILIETIVKKSHRYNSIGLTNLKDLKKKIGKLKK